MAEYFPGPNPDFSSLAAEGSGKTPEMKPDDDDDDLEEDPRDKKSLADELSKSSKNTETANDERSEKKEKSVEDEASLQHMGRAEKQDAAKQIAEARGEEIHDELAAAEQDSPAEIEAVVAADFIENLEQAIDEGQQVEAALDTAKAATLGAAGIENLGGEPEPEVEAELATVEPIEIEPPIVDEADAEDVDDTVATAAGSGGSGTSPPTPPPPGGGPGAPTPPMPPFPPYGPGGPGGPGGVRRGGPGGPGGGPGGPRFNIPLRPNTAPNQPHEQDYINVRRSNRRHLLTGLLVGYMVGRRRGRIKTEKKLVPIQKKLEKEVKTLEQKIITTEERVRMMTRQQLEKQPEARQQVVERLQASRKNKVEKERKKREQEPEKLGKFALFGEGPLATERFERARRSEHQDALAEKELLRRVEAIPERLKTPEKPKDVAVLTVAELLAIAQHIEIEDSSLKRLYEANRVDQEGLRRIVRAYLRGDRIERLLRENLQSPERFNYAETQHRNKPGQAAGQQAFSAGAAAQSASAQAFHHQKTQESQNPANPYAPVQTQPVRKKSRTTFISVVIVLAIAAILYLTVW